MGKRETDTKTPRQTEGEIIMIIVINFVYRALFKTVLQSAYQKGTIDDKVKGKQQ